MDYSTLSPTVSSSIQMFATNGLLGNTIEEKTRRILGWTEHTAPSMTVGPLAPAAHVNQRKAEKCRKTKSASITASAPYPYSLLANESNRGRKSSCPSLCNMNETVILRQQLTPPPSPGSVHGNVSIVSLPRRSPPMALPPPPPPAYHSLPVNNKNNCTSRKTTSCEYFSDNSAPSPECITILPISPVSPAAPTNFLQTTISAQQQQQDGGRISCRISTSEVFERLRKEVPHLPKEQSKFRILVQTVANVIELETKLAHLQEQTRTLSNMLSQNSNNAADPMASGRQQKLAYGQQIAVDTSSLTNPLSINSECISKQIGQYPFDGTFITADVPDDLRGIDVTAFKSMMCSPHSDMATSSSVASCQHNSFPTKIKNSNLNSSYNDDDGCNNYFDNNVNYDCESFPNLNYNGLDPLLVDTSY